MSENSIAASIGFGQSQLTATDAPKREAELLLMHALQCSHAHLIAHRDALLSKSQMQHFRDLVTRRAQGEPMAYITGTREFFGLPLHVDKRVLIPRPDTELLVELALKVMPIELNTSNEKPNDSHQQPHRKPFRVLDLGTGSGAIALALAHGRPCAHVTACDASVDALDCARANATRLSINNITFIQSNWFEAFICEQTDLESKQFDLIVSNPPYIRNDDPHLQQGDLRFEPITALTAGSDGMQDLRHLIKHAPFFLRPGAWLMIEHGFDQGKAVREMFNQYKYNAVKTHSDWGGNERVTIATIAM